jgi:hypothetical protein
MREVDCVCDVGTETGDVFVDVAYPPEILFNALTVLVEVVVLVTLFGIFEAFEDGASCQRWANLDDELIEEPA